MSSASGGSRRVFINGLSIGTGGGYTVGREVLRHLAKARPDWRFTMGVIDGHPMHAELLQEPLPDNAELFWAPSSALGRFGRRAYERNVLAKWVNDSGFDAVFQLNGMVLPGVRVPTLAHFQDPFPYRPEAWRNLGERILSMIKRRSHRDALRRAALCGWTSSYLRDLVCGRERITPKRSVVYFNGVPDGWLERARGPLPAWDQRPLELMTVSTVTPYKRQSLVIEALAELRKTPGLEATRYRILGDCPEGYRAELLRQAARLGVGDAVSIEGRVSNATVEQALASARVLPLMSVCESFGIPTIEAMTYGTPVVVADCCALPEVCGDAALACPMDNVPALTGLLRRVLTEPGLAETLRTAGVRRVQRFNWSVIGGQMADGLDQILRG